jgi:hypothetical protein
MENNLNATRLAEENILPACEAHIASAGAVVSWLLQHFTYLHVPTVAMRLRRHSAGVDTHQVVS